MKNIKMTIWSVMTMGVLLSGYAFAAPDQNPPQAKTGSAMREHKRGEFFKELALTEEQKTALEENRKKNRGNARDLHQTLDKKMTEMRQELQKQDVDMAKINQIQGELKEVQGKLMDQRLEGILQVRKILTPEQFKKFSDKMEEHRKHWNKESGAHGWGKRHDREEKGAMPEDIKNK